MWKTNKNCLCRQKLTGLAYTPPITIYGCRSCDRILIHRPSANMEAWYQPEDISHLHVSALAKCSSCGG